MAESKATSTATSAKKSHIKQETQAMTESGKKLG